MCVNANRLQTSNVLTGRVNVVWGQWRWKSNSPGKWVGVDVGKKSCAGWMMVS